MAQPSLRSRLIGKIPRVADIVTFQLERPPEYEYQAGQWFVVAFPGPVEPWVHHFSHSNSPAEPFLEFTTRLRGSEFKNALDALPVGAEVEVEGPYGTFTLGDDPGRVAFITGGIGITCVRSILRWLAGYTGSSRVALPSGPAMPRQIVVIDANRSEENIPFREEFAEIEAALPALRMVHVLSRPGAGWPGYRGHIDEHVLARELPEPQLWSYYLSGPPSLGQSMRELLLGWGIRSDAIKVERFDGYE
jgi:ferredoxin-NADP reductase